jgi:hypothetical protein
MNGRRLLVALSAAVLTISLTSPAYAQSKAPPRKKGQEAPAQAAPAGVKKPAARKVLRLEEMRVEGRIQKPQALFLMPRANVTSGEQERTESFLPKTKDAVEKDPF